MSSVQIAISIPKESLLKLLLNRLSKPISFIELLSIESDVKMAKTGLVWP